MFLLHLLVCIKRRQSWRRRKRIYIYTHFNVDVLCSNFSLFLSFRKWCVCLPFAVCTNIPKLILWQIAHNTNNARLNIISACFCFFCVSNVGTKTQSNKTKEIYKHSKSRTSSHHSAWKQTETFCLINFQGGCFYFLEHVAGVYFFSFKVFLFFWSVCPGR